MKTRIALIVILLGTQVMIYAQKNIRTQTVERTFRLSSAPKFTANTQFANIVISHWDRNEIGIKIELKAKACSDALAAEMLDIAQYSFQNLPSGVTVRINYDSDKNNRIRKKCRQDATLNIVCRVWVPSKTAISTNTKFGNVELDHSDNNLLINTKFGNTKINGLLSQNGRISTEFGNLNISQTSGSQTVNIRHGNLQIASADNLRLSSAFGNVRIEYINSLVGSSEHGNMNLGRVNSATIRSFSFGSMTIGSLLSNLDVSGQFSHSNLTINNVEPSFTSIRIPNASFSNITLSIPRASFTADLNNRMGTIRVYDEKFKDSVIKTIGRYPTGEIKISNSFANITIKR